MNSRKSPYKYHKILKSITGFKRKTSLTPLIVGDDILSDDTEKTEALNSYFCSQTDINISEQHLESLRIYKSNHPRTRHEFQFTPITPREVMNTINTLDASKACGSDDLPIKLIKITASYIAEPLSKIFNKSFREVKFPTKWKLANVKPVYKGKGSPSAAASYRPISLLPCLSKIFEKLLFARIYDHQSMEWTGSIRWIYNPVQSRRIWIGLDQKFANSADSGLDWIQKCAMRIPYLET